MSVSAQQIEVIARACHEANRAWCIAHGDLSQKSWDDAEPWQRESAVSGVAIAIAGATPQQQHEAWCAHKLADGWTYGPVKDAAVKTHPCIVGYDDLPPEQKAKDGIYIATVKAFVGAFDMLDLA